MRTYPLGLHKARHGELGTFLVSADLGVKVFPNGFTEAAFLVGVVAHVGWWEN